MHGKAAVDNRHRVLAHPGGPADVEEGRAGIADEGDGLPCGSRWRSGATKPPNRSALALGAAISITISTAVTMAPRSCRLRQETRLDFERPARPAAKQPQVARRSSERIRPGAEGKHIARKHHSARGSPVRRCCPAPERHGGRPAAGRARDFQFTIEPPPLPGHRSHRPPGTKTQARTRG